MKNISNLYVSKETLKFSSNKNSYRYPFKNNKISCETKISRNFSVLSKNKLFQILCFLSKEWKKPHLFPPSPLLPFRVCFYPVRVFVYQQPSPCRWRKQVPFSCRPRISSQCHPLQVDPPKIRASLCLCTSQPLQLSENSEIQIQLPLKSFESSVTIIKTIL